MYILSLKLLSPAFKISYKSFINTVPRLKHTDLTNSLKHEIEKRWNLHASQGSFNLKDADKKYCPFNVSISFGKPSHGTRSCLQY